MRGGGGEGDGGLVKSGLWDCLKGWSKNCYQFFFRVASDQFYLGKRSSAPLTLQDLALIWERTHARSSNNDKWHPKRSGLSFARL
jgi:hypothetical protein